MYTIVKQVKIGQNDHGVDIIRPVILIDNHSEIMEFSTLEEAEDMRTTFQNNSTHGSVYEVKKI